MAKWEGFSEEDIKRIRASDRFEEGQPLNSPTLQAAKRQASISQSAARSRILQKSREGTEMSNEITDIPKTAFLSNSQEQTVKEVKRSDESQLLSADSGCGTTPNTSPSHGAVCLRIKEGKSYEVLSGSPGSLDEFQARQRLMEEQNRLKKELLAKKLADRKKQTTAEAHRLQQIQDELQKLDLLLSNDVSILRDQIEVASHDFMEAQKRYSKAEKEFLEAKLLLFDKLERKEMLTEHLCTIIEQNEIRKARKLSELMDKLDIGALAKEIEDEELKNVPKNEILSPLCALDEVSYAACSTLKPRKELGKPDGAAAKEKEDPAHLPPLPESENSEKA